MSNFNKGDKVIWDSYFGYDLGIFQGEGVTEDTYNIIMETGVVQGSNCLPKSEIHKYSPEKLKEVSKKYGYTKYFKEQ